VRIEQELAKAKQQRERAAGAMRGGGGGGKKEGGGSAPAKPCNCTPGDPLCSCL